MNMKNFIMQKLGYIPAASTEEISDSVEKQIADIKHVNNSLKATILNLQNERAFAAAQNTHLTSDWNNIYSTLTNSMQSGLVRVRQRCRELSMNDAWVKKYLYSLEKNVVGPDGFILRNNATEQVWDSQNKEYKKVYDKAANRIIQEAWEDWCLPNHCSVTEDISFRELTSLILKTMAVDGELLVKPVRSKDNKFSYSLQIIEADYLDESYNGVYNGNIVIMGVEMTPERKPVAYWLRKVDPYIALLYGAFISQDRVRIPIYDENGFIQIKHFFVKEHPSQVRGISWFAPVMIRIKMFSGFEEAILVDARLSANKTIKYEYEGDSSGDEINEANVPGAEVNITSDNKKDPAKLIQPSEPGKPLIVPRGMKAGTVDYKSPSGKEGDFQKWALRGIASGLNLAFITLANDYSDVNYTSSRTNLLEERDTWKQLHAWCRDHLLNWNFAEWLKMALLTQNVPLPASKFQKFNKPWFQGRAWKWVSPKDEAEAVLLMLSNDAWLFEEFLAENGWTLEEWIDKKKAEKELFEKNNLPYPGTNYKQIKPIDKSEPQNGKAKSIPKEFLIEN